MGKTTQAHFCKCGTISLIDNAQIDWIEDDIQNRCVHYTCPSCGEENYISLNDWYDEFTGAGFAYCCSSNNPNAPKTRTIEPKYIKVPLKNGKYACHKINGIWYDEDYNRCDVDTQRLIKENPDTFEQIVGYLCGIDWSGTPYDY